jgi:hypothetical protein
MDLTGGRISQLHSPAMLRLRGWLQNPQTRPEGPVG